MTDPTINKRMQRYRGRQKQRGLVEVRVYVPLQDRERVQDYAKKLRLKAKVRVHS